MSRTASRVQSPPYRHCVDALPRRPRLRHRDHRNAVLFQRFENRKNPLLGPVKECPKLGQSHLLLGRERISILLLYLPE